MNRNIPLFKICWDEQDVEKVTEAIKKGMNWATGPNVQQFENLLAGYVGVNYALTFNAGTSALHAILLSYGIGKLTCPPKIGPLEMRDSCRIRIGGSICENEKVFGGAGIQDSQRG